jgi:hypothetical protein
MKRTNPTAMEEYEQYKLMLSKMAWDFVRTTGIEFDEAMSTANLAFFEAKRTFNPDLSTFCTHLWHTTSGYFQNEMSDYLDNLNTSIPIGRIDTLNSRTNTEFYQSIMELCEEQAPSREIPFRDWIMGLSDVAQQLVMMVFADPCDFIGITMATLSKTLKHQLGWTWATSRSTIAEIKSELKAF